MDEPLSVYSEAWRAGHVQGIAADERREYFYFSFTDLLVKVTAAGKPVGSVTGLYGHLGCLAYNARDGRLYASLEYKSDAIGRAIRDRLNAAAPSRDSFYAAVFDVDKIDRLDMDAEQDGVMSCVYLPTVAEDYAAVAPGDDGEPLAHRYGCSGIDGMTFGPAFGGGGDGWFLYVAYGIYGDTQRDDNDYQVILQYDTSGWNAYRAPLLQGSAHQSGPKAPENRYFVRTGNTTYGIQNLEYDPHTGHWLAAVYRGKKSCFPNYSLFVIDGTKPPRDEVLRGYRGETGQVLSLWNAGLFDEASGIYGWESLYGSTGMLSLGDGRFYLSEDGAEGDSFYSHARLYRWTGQTPCPFSYME